MSVPLDEISFYLKEPHWTVIYRPNQFASCSDIVIYQQVSISWVGFAAFGEEMPASLGRKKTVILGVGRKKKSSWGLTLWDCRVLPCKTNTQRGGFAFLTKSPLTPGAPAAGAGTARAGPMGVQGGLASGALGAGAGRGRATWCRQPDFASLFLSTLQAVLMLKSNNRELMIFKAFLSDLSWECQVGKNKT